jgi:integrase
MAFDQVRHTKEDALNQREFQLLLEGAEQMQEQDDIQARFVLLVGGRLGLRRGEMAHMREEWIDWRRNMIVIPRQDDCDQGRKGVCGSCRQHAKQRVAHNEDLTFEEALDLQWRAKTDEAAREVPFGFDPRVTLCIERFFDNYDRYPYSAQSVNRRVERAASLADELSPDPIYPHCLRATAASYHASRGLGTIPLQSLMGWSQLSTAQNYVTSSGENTKRALNFTHS